jgi:Amt family ammonium transporter
LQNLDVIYIVYVNLLSSDYIAHLDGFSMIPGGWINRNYIQLAYQLADCVSGFAYSFFGTCIILFLMNLVPGLSLRASAEEEEMGLDDAQLGEFAYDYVELRRDPAALIIGEDTPSAKVSGDIERAELAGVQEKVDTQK